MQGGLAILVLVVAVCGVFVCLSEMVGRVLAEQLTQSEFADHFRESFRVMWCLAVGIVNDKTLAEDVVQEAGLAAWRKLGEFQPGSNFKAWLGSFVRFTALNQARKRKRHRAADLAVCEGDAAVVSGVRY